MTLPRQLPPYRRDLPYGYALGHFPVLELLRHAPGAAREVRVHRDLAAARRGDLERRCAAAGVPIRRDDAAVEARRSKGTARVLAIFDKPAEGLDEGADHLALVRTGDPGNVGTLLRTALAFGVRDVALVGGVDPFAPHVVRASLGAAFAVRFRSFPDLGAYRAAHPRHDALLLHGAADRTPDDVVATGRPRALVAGPEWPGLGTDDLRHGTPVRIPIDRRVESLNVAVAVGVALYALGRRPPSGGGS